jgi:hypothetical protein
MVGGCRAGLPAAIKLLLLKDFQALPKPPATRFTSVDTRV